MLAIAGPGEGLVQNRADLDWEANEEATVLTVIDSNIVTVVRASGDKASVGRKLDRDHGADVFEGIEESFASGERPNTDSRVE